MNFKDPSILNLYKGATRVALLARDNEKNKWYHIFSVIELLPIEIPEYSIPTSKWYKNKTIRSNFSSKSDLYSFSLVIDKLTVDEAFKIFNSPIQNNIIDGEANYYFNDQFIKEPSGDVPLVIQPNIYKNEDIAAILPKRDSGSFVWAQIDNERIVEKMFWMENITHEMKSANQLTNDWLGFDLWSRPEHIGNIYLSAPNPYFRDLDISLSRNPHGIFYHLKLRKGIKEGFKIRIIDMHGENIAFDKIYDVSVPIGLIELPHEPNLTELRIYNSTNDLIYTEEPAAFIKSINMQMSMKQADFHIKVHDNKKSKEFVVEKYSSEKPLNIGQPEDFNAAYYFKKAEKSRKHLINKKNKDFIFFKGGKDGENEIKKQKEEAKIWVRDLIDRANIRCYICDPYFATTDLIDYAFFIKNTNVELKILNSTDCINKETATSLLDAIKQYNEKPFQKIELRTLKSNVLHDRFIIADNSVWFVGTSLNQIGKKATCIAKVPESDNIEIIREVEAWFFNKGNNYSKSLEEYADNFTE